MYTLLWLVLTVAQRGGLLGVTGVSARTFAIKAALCALTSFVAKVVGFPTVQRLNSIAVIATAHFAWWPAHSPQIGQPTEGVIITVALLAGELIAHPFQLLARIAFAREAAAAGRLLGAFCPPPRGRDAPVHPLTLRFSNGALEHAWSARSFGQSYPTVVATSLAFSLLLGLMIIGIARIEPSPTHGSAYLEQFRPLVGSAAVSNELISVASHLPGHNRRPSVAPSQRRPGGCARNLWLGLVLHDIGDAGFYHADTGTNRRSRSPCRPRSHERSLLRLLRFDAWGLRDPARSELPIS